MNIVGRLTSDPEIRYTRGDKPMTIARYTLAVNRRFKKQGESDADFIKCVAFGNSAEFADKYFRKGQQIAVSGRIQTGSYEKNGQKVYTFDVIVEDQYFADGKK